MAQHLINAMWSLRIWKDSRGQDVLEYALYVAVIGTLYAAFSPSVATSVSAIFSKISTNISSAASTGG